MKQKSSSEMTRREFINKSLKSGAAVAISPLLFSTLNGCGLSKAYIQKDHELIKNTKWDTNQAIPVPDNGCYTGFWVQVHDRKRLEQGALEEIKKYTGYFPAVQMLGISHIAIIDDFFPFDSAGEAIRQGIIPAVGHAIMPTDFGEIVDGKHDQILESLAKKIKKLNHPIFFIPYKEINRRPHWWSQLQYTGAYHPTFKKAWRRMHKIFEVNGANKNAVWSTHFIASGSSKTATHYSAYYPGDEFVDWVGFTAAALPYMRTENTDFRYIFSGDYKYVRQNYSKKPIALWEFGAQENSYQPKWITNAFKSIKDDFPAIKAFTYTAFAFRRGSTSLSPEARKAYKNAITDSYFIKGPEKLKP
jgi:beta-mannanase